MSRSTVQTFGQIRKSSGCCPTGARKLFQAFHQIFSPKDGQLWGNPVFDWQAMEEDGFAWWIERVRRLTELVDVVRIDHFRGLAAGWVVPAGDATARGGRWERAPGSELFKAIEATLGHLPIVVEDLGIITPDVVDLRKQVGLQGMNVLQFAFDGNPDNVYLPHNYRIGLRGLHWYARQSDDDRLVSVV